MKDGKTLQSNSCKGYGVVVSICNYEQYLSRFTIGKNGERESWWSDYFEDAWKIPINDLQDVLDDLYKNDIRARATIYSSFEPLN